MNASPGPAIASAAEPESAPLQPVLNRLNLVLAAIILYIPYQFHFPVSLDVMGLNLTNILFAAALLMVLARKARPAAPTPLKWCFVFLFAMLAASFAIGQMYDDSRFFDDLTALKTAVFYLLLYFLFYHGVRDLRSTRFLFGAILFVTFVVSLQAVRQGLDYGAISFSDSKRAAGPFAKDYVGANLAAGFLIMFVPLFFAVAVVCKSRPVARLVALGCTLLGIFAVFFTFSRQAYFILPVLLLLLGARRNLWLGLLVVLALASYESWVPSSVIDRILVTEQTDSHGEKKLDESTESRFIIWAGAAQMIAERPWGIGLNHFKREIGRYVPAYDNYDAHNAYVLMTTEAGPLGVASMVILLLGLLYLGIRVDRLGISEDSRLLGSAMVISTLGVILANLFGSRIFQGEVTGNYWILAGMVARYYTLEMERSAGRAGDPVATGSEGAGAPAASRLAG
jgi:O-antigen ligase